MVPHIPLRSIHTPSNLCDRLQNPLETSPIPSNSFENRANALTGKIDFRRHLNHFTKNSQRGREEFTPMLKAIKRMVKGNALASFCQHGSCQYGACQHILLAWLMLAWLMLAWLMLAYFVFYGVLRASMPLASMGHATKKNKTPSFPDLSQHSLVLASDQMLAFMLAFLASSFFRVFLAHGVLAQRVLHSVCQHSVCQHAFSCQHCLLAHWMLASSMLA